MVGVRAWLLLVLTACRLDFDEQAPDAASSCRVQLQPDVRATYYGIATDDSFSSVHHTADGAVIATAVINAGGYPNVTGLQPTYGGQADALLVRMSGDLSTVQQTTYFGAAPREIGWAFNFEPDDSVVLSAWSSGGWPVTPGAASTVFENFPDDWALARISPDLTTNIAATYWYANDPADEQLSNACVDATNGDIYAVGEHLLGTSPMFTAPGYDLVKNGGTDAAAIRFDAALSTVKNNTLYGLGDPALAGQSGAPGEEAFGACVVHSGDDIFITGVAAGTLLGTLATPGAYRETPVDVNDPFICRFSSDLVERRACTHLGLTNFISLNERYWVPDGFFVHPNNGDLYVVQSVPASVGWIPATAGTLQTQSNGGTEIAITRFKPDLSAVVASTFVGTAGDDYSHAAVVLPDGSIAIAGSTTGSFATTADAIRPNPPGGTTDGLLFVIDPDLTTIKSATYFGDPSASDVIGGLDFDPTTRSLYLTGSAGAGLSISANAAQATYGGGSSDGFIARVGICAPD